MRTSPSIVPYGADQDTYLVLDDMGRLGCSWRETRVESADRETLIRDLVEGQYSRFGSSPSMSPRAGRATSRSISPTSCVVATLNLARFRPQCCISSRQSAGAELSKGRPSNDERCVRLGALCCLAVWLKTARLWLYHIRKKTPVAGGATGDQVRRCSDPTSKLPERFGSLARAVAAICSKLHARAEHGTRSSVLYRGRCCCHQSA